MLLNRRSVGAARCSARLPVGAVRPALRRARLATRAMAPPFRENAAEAPATVKPVLDGAAAPVTSGTTALDITAEARLGGTVEATESVDPQPTMCRESSGPTWTNTILLQGFAWDSWEKGGGNWYAKVQEAIPLIKELGANYVWLPPPSQSVSNEGYLPGQLYDLTSKYGNKEQLIELNKALKEAGIKPMADIVINHRCADEQHNGVWNKFTDKQVDEHGRTPIDWGRWAITSDDPHFKGKGNPDTGDDFHAAPDLDHLNPDLRAALKDWLHWLQEEVGFEGWRFDYVKGYGAEFIQEYVDGSLGPETFNVGELWTDMHWSDSHLEYEQNNSRQKLCDWINGTGKRACAFDFTTKAQLQEAMRHCQYDRLRDHEGRACGLIGWWGKRAVTFIENHDTGSTQQHWPFPSDKVAAGYAYILTHPGVPCVFWDHVTTWGDELRKEIMGLAALRRRHDIRSDAKLEILRADRDQYVAKVDDRVLIKLGPRQDMGDLTPSEAEWKFSLHGNDYAVWERK